MDRNAFSRPSGDLIEVQRDDTQQYLSFVPAPLPPPGESVIIGELAGLLADAEYSLGKLDGSGRYLPNPDLLYYPYLRREAVASSRIEGTRASFADLALYDAVREAPPGSDVMDVHNYVLAFEYGLHHIHEAGVTTSLVRELHRKLLVGARGEKLAGPGEFCFTQNHIGGATIAEARFVPPPPESVVPVLETLFSYLAGPDSSTPVLVQAAWAHYQFETIHPFIDGNGRVGRLLIPLLVAWRRGLDRSLLYLAPYFERRRTEYVDRLHAVSTQSDWSGWLRFFLSGVLDQAQEGERLTNRIMEIRQTWLDRLEAAGAPHSVHRIADLVIRYGSIEAKDAVSELGISRGTAYGALSTLVELNILSEMTGRTRGQVFGSRELFDLLEP